MNHEDILRVLSTSSSRESSAVATLRVRGRDLISANAPDNLNRLPTTLLDLLTQIIKPLFTSTKHPSLTSTGRKNLVSSAPAITPRFGPLYEEESKPWKTTLTVPVLKYILSAYASLPLDRRKSTIEGQFHLLVPPVLNMIDDPDVDYKSAGCGLLCQLCEVLRSAQSEMLTRTGLADVFVDALQPNLTLLPTLTPEHDSLLVLRELYPAYLALVDARFPTVRASSLETPTPTPASTPPTTPESKTVGGSQTTGQRTDDGDINNQNNSRDARARRALLARLYRQGIVAGLTHLAGTSGFSSTISVPLTTLLLAQIGLVVMRLGIASVRLLDQLLPLLRAGLTDPFILLAPGMATAALDALDTVVQVCAPRIREKYSIDVLRGLVASWLNCLDDNDNDNDNQGQGAKDPDGDGAGVRIVMRKVKAVTATLRSVVDAAEWDAVTARLLEEEEDLRGLFEA